MMESSIHKTTAEEKWTTPELDIFKIKSASYLQFRYKADSISAGKHQSLRKKIPPALIRAVLFLQHFFMLLIRRADAVFTR